MRVTNIYTPPKSKAFTKAVTGDWCPGEKRLGEEPGEVILA